MANALTVPNLNLKSVLGRVLTAAEADEDMEILRDFSNQLASILSASLNTNGLLKTGAAVNGMAWAADTGAADVLAVTLSPVPTAYADGMFILVVVNTTNTGPATLNVNALGATALKKLDGTDLVAGDLKADSVVAVMYYNAEFLLLAGASSDAVHHETALAAAPALDDEVRIWDTSGSVSAKVTVEELLSATYGVPGMGPGWAIQGGVAGATSNTRARLYAEHRGNGSSHIILISAEGSCRRVTKSDSFVVSADIDVSGPVAQGCDGAWTAQVQQWYYLWAIYNASTDALSLIWSESSTAPTLPTGYTYYCLVSSAFCTTIGPVNLRTYEQYNNRVWFVDRYVIGSAAGDGVATGAAGDFNPVDLAGADLTQFQYAVSPMASQIYGVVGGKDQAAAQRSAVVTLSPGYAFGRGVQTFSFAGVNTTAVWPAAILSGVLDQYGAGAADIYAQAPFALPLSVYNMAVGGNGGKIFLYINGFDLDI